MSKKRTGEFAMGEPILQFKVTLRGIRPQIWRRLQVPASYTFWDLHVAIQDAMGWADCHLHAFRIEHPDSESLEVLGIPNEEWIPGQQATVPGWEIQILDYFQTLGDKAEYEYDFGDSWIHDVVLEEMLPPERGAEYPRCLAGRRACPPEDCGGIPGYKELIEVMNDPAHERRTNLVDWLGKGYEPESFDAAKVRFDDPEERWQRAFSSPELLM